MLNVIKEITKKHLRTQN